MRRAYRTLPALALIALVSGSCRQPLHVSTLQIGRSLNVDRTVGIHATRFKPTDTIYSAVLTDRAGASTITARWWHAGRVLSETPKSVSYKGRAATDFLFVSPGGFPTGDYQVEILVDGQSVASREFHIQP
ncbi:MAG: hypothetical protein ABL971_05895 [Vicinamibacterales bacterium]